MSNLLLDLIFPLKNIRGSKMPWGRPTNNSKPNEVSNNPVLDNSLKIMKMNNIKEKLIYFKLNKHFNLSIILSFNKAVADFEAI